MFAQNNLTPLFDVFNEGVSIALVHDSTGVHQFQKPLLDRQTNYQNLHYYQRSRTFYDKASEIILSKSLIQVEKKDFWIKIDPLLNFQFGRDLSDTSGQNLYYNTRGARIEINLGKKVGIGTQFIENQIVVPQYIHEFIAQSQVSPGQGRVKIFKNKGYDYTMASGYVSYSPIKALNFQLGTGKHFIGYGQSSLMIGNTAFNYPYIQASYHFLKNKLAYQSTYGFIQTVERLPVILSSEALFKRKNLVINSLSYHPLKNLEVSVTEAHQVQLYQDSSYAISQQMGDYLPIIGLNSAVRGLDHYKNKILWSIQAQYRCLNQLAFYGQLTSSRFIKNDFAYQLGLKWAEPFQLKNLMLQLEWNKAESKIYTSAFERQEWSHYNQSLAHPLGNDFQEWVFKAHYMFKHIFLDLKTAYVQYNRVDALNYQQDQIFDLYTLDERSSGNMMQVQSFVGYRINPKNGLHVGVGMVHRQEDWQGNQQKTQWFFLRLATHLALGKQYL